MVEKTESSIECRLVESLIPYARNSRTHPDAQVTALAASIEEFGLAGAIVIRDGVIAKGHGTLQAVRKLYAAGKRLYPVPGKAHSAEPFPEEMVPVQDASGWTDAQFRAFVIADNRLAEGSGWDSALLADELEDLLSDGFDIDLTGFDNGEIDRLMGDLEEADELVDSNQRKIVDEKKFLLMLEFDSERSLERAYEEAVERGVPCKIIE